MDRLSCKNREPIYSAGTSSSSACYALNTSSESEFTDAPIHVSTNAKPFSPENQTSFIVGGTDGPFFLKKMPPVGVKEVVAGASQGRRGCDCSEDPDSAKNEVRTRTGRVQTKTLAQRSESCRNSIYPFSPKGSCRRPSRLRRCCVSAGTREETFGEAAVPAEVLSPPPLMNNGTRTTKRNSLCRK